MINQLLTKTYSKDIKDYLRDEFGIVRKEPKVSKTLGKYYHLSRVGLGSFALRRKSCITDEEWQTIKDMKDRRPKELADYMKSQFINFFSLNNNFGSIDAITVPPRSFRNLGKLHVMDILGEELAKEINTEFIQLFLPWEKKNRGRFANQPEIEVIMDRTAKFIKKVVWVIDDVTTTNYTLQTSVQTLIKLNIHTHGLAYICMSGN